MKVRQDPLLAAAHAAPLKGTAKALLLAFCHHYQRHGVAARWALPSVAEAIGRDVRTVQRYLGSDHQLVLEGYLTRRDERRDNGHHHAPEFCLTDPAKWPKKPSAAIGGGDKLSPVTKRHQGVVTNCHPNYVFNNSPVVSNETTPPAVAGTVAEVESNVVCLETHRAKTAPRKSTKGRTEAEDFVSGTGLSFAKVAELYNRHCHRDGEDPADLPLNVSIGPKRRPVFNARCRELAREGKATYQWFGMYFRYVRANNFLNGTANRLAGKRAWQADLMWLLDEENMAKVRGHRYRDSLPEGYANEPDPADEPAPANDHAPEARRAVH